MLNDLAIKLENVTKIYKLYGSRKDQLINILGLESLGFKTKTTPKEFVALKEISLDVPRGQRIGIIGRNGAGKTTLLKMVSGNFAPTSGRIEVNGTIQALMSVGIGFHPEYSGRENIKASLQYNGLKRNEYQKAMEEIIEFCELDDFVDQPFRTYSLGMQARLMFATATAIRPDILIVDEVLSAGDAYFVAKSKKRVENMVKSGCTMLLVSHSTQQILELCERAIWLDQGQIRMHDNSFLVVKAYEEYLYGCTEEIRTSDFNPATNSILGEKIETGLINRDQQSFLTSEANSQENLLCLQRPHFLPHGRRTRLSTEGVSPTTFYFPAPGGISRWQSETGVKVCGFAIVTENGISNNLICLKPACIVIHLVGEIDGHMSCRYGILINDLKGNAAARIYSPEDRFQIRRGNIRKVCLLFNPLQLGPGEYNLGISVLEATDMQVINKARRYDLLGRSFQMRVILPDSLSAIEASFFHSAEWEFME